MRHCARLLIAAALLSPVMASPVMLSVMAAETNVAAPPPSVTALPPLEELNATRDRPLFTPTRRPPEAAAAPAAAAAIAEPTSFDYQLVGIVLGPETRIAMFRKGDAKPDEEGTPASEVARRKVGDKLDNWTIETIAINYVVLQGDAKRVRLRLYSQKNTGIQVGGAGTDHERPLDQPSPDPDDAAVKDPDGTPDDAQSDPVDEEIVPAGPPKIIPPTPRKATPPPRKPQPPRRPGRPGRNPAPNNPRP